MADHNIAASASPPEDAGRGRDLVAPGPLRAISARIGKYEVHAETGHGAAVRVFHAFDRDTGRPVTLKVLADVGDKRLAERFRREVAGAANLRTARVAAIYELGEHVGLPFAAIERLGDDDVGRAIATARPLTLLQKMLIMSQVAEGMQAAYRGGLGYVGIRPSGIALSGDGGAIIQDFGIVRLTPGENDEARLYAAPEELAPGFAPDALCDIFAFGAVYYALIAGAHPLRSIGLREPAPLRSLAPECPEALERLVARALDPQRDMRYQGLDDLRDDAEPILCELKRARAAELLADARRSMDAQELDAAPRLLREVLELDPDNREAQRLRAELRGAIEQRGVQRRVDALLREADEEATSRHFERAVEILTSVLRLDGTNLPARGRLEEMLGWLERIRRSKQLTAEARQLLERQNLAEARAKAMDALQEDLHSAEAAELLAAICAAIERREKEAKIEEQLAKAKSLLLLEAFDDAAAILETLRTECPDSPEAGHWLNHVQTQKAKAARQARLREQLEKARSLQAERQFARSAALLEALGAEFPEEEEVADLLAQARQESERDAAVREVLEEVEWLAEQDRPDLALQLLREKCAEFPDQPDLAARLAAAERTLPVWENRRFIQDVLSRAAALERLQQWPVALTVIEEALEASPGSEELRQAAEGLRGRLREQEHRRKLARRLEAIAQKIAARAWPQALSLIEWAQAEFPGEPELETALKEARAGLRRAECESIVAEARQWLADGDTEQAEEALRKGMERLGDEPGLLALREELEAGKQYRDEWHRAQVLFGRRRFQEAEQILAGLAAENRPEVQALLEMAREARAASEEKQFYSRGREKALKLIEQRELEQAADLIRNLLAVFPGDPILERDLRAASGAAPCPAAHNGEEVETERREAAEAVPAPRSAPAAMRFLARIPATVRWTAVGMGAVWLLLFAGAAVWRVSRGGLRRATPAMKAAAKIPNRGAATVQAAPPQSPAPDPPPPSAPAAAPAAGNAVPGVRPPARTAAAAHTRPFSMPALPRADASRSQAQVALPPPDTAPALSEPAASGPLASVMKPVAAPVAPPNAPAATRAAPAARRGGVVEQPKTISAPPPEIPEFARLRALHGIVTLEATVDPRGTVTAVSVLNGDAVLAAAARNAILKWRYQPARLNGQPIEAKVIVRVNFDVGK